METVGEKVAIAQKLGLARQELLDVGLRGNSLLHVPARRSSFLEIFDADAAALFGTLTGSNGSKRPLQFVPAPDENETGDRDGGDSDAGDEPVAESLSLGDEPPLDAVGPAVDSSRFLQVRLPQEKLDAQLLRMESQAHTLLHEQGIDVLFLALGFLEWCDDTSSSAPRYAPLVLVPVELQRDSVRSRFRLAYTDAELGPNLNLGAKLKGDFRLDLPEFPDEFDFRAYVDAVALLVSDRPRWRVLRDKAVLGFFSYGKFQMYVDLDPESWPEENPLLKNLQLKRLFGEGFEADASLVEGVRGHEALTAPENLHLVKDADSSQTEAILAVMEGANLVVQGPPGTGKSQTITNVIAEALARGKRVLFVAQKMAALEVVKARLDECHLGDSVLELHSHKSNKKAVLGSLRHVFEQGRPEAPDRDARYRRLSEVREALDGYVADLGRPILNSGLHYVDCVGRMLALKNQPRLAGIAPVRFEWLRNWDAEDLERGRRAIRAAGDYLREFGAPEDNPFRHSRRTSLSPNDDQWLARQVARAWEPLGRLIEDAAALAQAMQIPVPATFADIAILHRAGKRALDAPHLQGVRVSTQEWQVRRDDIREAVACGAEMHRLHEQLSGHFIDAAFEADLLAVRVGLAGRADKWWRVFSGPYRQAKSTLRGYMKGALSGPPVQWLEWVDGLLAYRRHHQRLRELEPVCQSLFGAQWQGVRSDWAVLGRLADWIIELYEAIGKGDLPQGLADFLEGDPDLRAWVEPVEALAVQSAHIQGQFQELITFLEWAHGPVEEVTLETWRARLEAWRQTRRLYEITRFNQIEKQVEEAGLSGLIARLRDWRDPSDVLEDWLLLGYYSGLVDTAYGERSRIGQFDRLGQERLLSEFAKLDRDVFAYAQEKLVVGLHAELPPFNAPGEMDLLRREFSKQRRHLPIRRLMHEAGSVIQKIKPVFMMSPMSVATYLPQGRLHFDLVIFDEASQIPAPESLGAILRGDQVVVVGDSRQMPPTDFFGRAVELTDDEAEQSVTADLESILDLMQAQGVPERMLRWHYRSRDSSLIAVSNDQFYDNSLMIFPSPGMNPDARGLHFHHLPGTHYDRGGSRANRGEALAVAQAVMAHARINPELSLGVVAFSTAQREVILLEVERLRRAHPETEPFFRHHEGGEFFIKNLENVQGDERDVIFISIGYGFTESGRFGLNFGPLNTQGGERRLNVLITRARLAMDVFCNFRADDLRLSPSSPFGVRALKAFLHYAETRDLPSRELTGREPDSPFENEVMQAIQRLGYDVEPQVGSQGFYIDLAVRDPVKPGRFVLAVECDGASYHSTAVARDRDRIRQAVLEGLGWTFHRVWSTEWFRNPQAETERLKEAIEAALRHAQAQDDLAGKQRQTESAVGVVAQQVVKPGLDESAAGPFSAEGLRAEATVPATRASRESVGGSGDSGSGTVSAVAADVRSGDPGPASGAHIKRTAQPTAEYMQPAVTDYQAADESVLGLQSNTTDFHEIPLERLATAVFKVVQAEGPVHTAVLTARLLSAANVGRAGVRIQSSILSALNHLEQKDKIRFDGEFAALPEQLTNPPLRDWSILVPSQRRLEYVSDTELAHVLYRTVINAYSIDRNDAMSAALASLGFKRLTSQASERLLGIIEDLLERGAIRNHVDRLQPGPVPRD